MFSRTIDLSFKLTYPAKHTFAIAFFIRYLLLGGFIAILDFDTFRLIEDIGLVCIS